MPDDVMGKYRKKPVVIDAVQWFPDPELGEFNWNGYVNRVIGTDKHGVEYTVCDVGLRTLEGFMHITPGSWIITGVKGDRYACKPDIFAATYEPVSHQAPAQAGDYVLVPREPTQEMLAAARDPVWGFSPEYAPIDRDPLAEHEESAESTAKKIWQAMLAAAPKTKEGGE